MTSPFKDPVLVKSLTDRINRICNPDRIYTLMEVCGTHTQEIGKWAIRSLLPKNIRLVSGPGCPVCVTPGSYIDNAANLALQKNITIATFGDLIRVPGNVSSLENARSMGASLRIVYSPLEAVELASKTKNEVVFLSVGFETTIAAIAATIIAARDSQLKNISFYSSLRLVPPALLALINDPNLKIDGFILPGHVSTIIGLEPYNLVSENGITGVIAGFEPIEILMSILSLVSNINLGNPIVENNYKRAVPKSGNVAAKRLFASMFDVCKQEWRGIGVIPKSGYKLNKEFQYLDAALRFNLIEKSTVMPEGCSCGNVLKGIMLPEECPIFGTECNPSHPVGPCMVSNEGSCAAAYKYKR